jgi:hypothetical protein
VTFYRPFSYRRGYFHPQTIAEQLSDETKRKELLTGTRWNEGLFGIRFLTEDAYSKQFIALRKVTLTEVRSGDALNLRFRLGPYIEPRVALGKKVLPYLDLSAVLPDTKQTKLFIELPGEIAKTARDWHSSDLLPSEFWQCLEGELSATAWGRVRNAVLLRASGIRNRGKATLMVPEEIDRASHIWGYTLQAGKAYDLTLSHYRLIEKGIERPTIEHQFQLNNPADEMTASKRSIQPLGNYRDDDLWISPAVPKEGPIEVAFEPSRIDQPQVIVDQGTSKMIGLKVPVLVTKKAWPTVRWINLALVLSCLGFSGYLFRIYMKASDTGQKALLVAIATLLSLSANAIKDLLAPKE